MSDSLRRREGGITPDPGLAPLQRRAVLARLMMPFVSGYLESEKGARPGAPDDGEESKNDPTAEP